ncbi:MAG: amidohydrolase family protein, partial [Planctomycetes bacterium]|nr:amidohydrolase family protein [Planctomycetota bacterium]
MMRPSCAVAKDDKPTPGYIDAHVHVESSMMMPGDFQRAVLPKGTTTAICDPHEVTNVQGLDGLKYFLDTAAHLDMDLQVMLSSCVPS